MYNKNKPIKIFNTINFRQKRQELTMKVKGAIKLSSIKTRDQFYDFANVWYQRIKNLVETTADESKDYIYNYGAIFLVNEMEQRILKLNKIAIQLDIPKLKGTFESGGLAMIGDSKRPEIIINKNIP